MADKRIPTPDELRQLLTYVPETGLLFWNRRLECMFASKNAWSIWNSRYAGKAAFDQLTARGYLAGKVMGRTYLAHRIAWAIHQGAWPKMQIDHINGRRTDNRISNLRDVGRVANQRNMRRSSRNTSGVTGVYFECRTGKWCAHICDNGRQRQIGRFADFSDAANARRAEEVRLGYHENHGR